LLLAAFILAALAWAWRAEAQLVNGNQWPNPRLNVLTPTGGKAGTTFEVSFAGTDTETPESLWFSHPGMKGTPITPPPPPPPDPKAKPDPNKKDMGPPPITKFSVTIDKDVPPGFYDVRLVNKHGISNPRIFVVGELNEVTEKEPNNDVEQAQRVEVGTTVNGVINPQTDVDYTVFAGKNGQRLLITCLTASIDSRLNPELSLRDAAGREIAVARPVIGQDAVLDVTLPADGDYTLRLAQFTYTAGGPDYFYRLTIASAPWVETVFPPMIEPGKAAQVTLYGHNLPGGKAGTPAGHGERPLESLTVTVPAPGDPAQLDKLTFGGLIPSQMVTLDGFEYRLAGPTGSSNPKVIAFAKAPVVIENDDNDTPDKAQEIPVPCEVAGRVDKKRDRDWYSFAAKKGDVLMIELFSERLGAPTDMYYKLVNMTGKAPQDITLQDDTAETLSFRLYTATLDPQPFRFVVPADGKYHLMVASHLADNQADPRHVYRLRISPEKPDFRLIVMPPEEFRPDACVLGQGGNEFYSVYVHRIDGFKADITLTVEGLPPGVTCPPQVLNQNLKNAHLVLSAAADAAPFTGPVKVVGTAVIGGQKVVHEARPATVTWPVQPQANIRAVTRLDRSLMLAVRDKAPGKLEASPDKVAASVGDKVNIPLKLTRTLAEFKSQFQVTPVPPELPPGVTFGNLNFTGGKDDLPLVLTVAPNTPPGKYNLVFRGFAPISPAAKAKPVNTILTSNPVELTVLPKQVANLSVDNANPAVKPGAEAAITVKVQRLFDYADAFKVELVLPPNAKGLTADPITIGPGANEAKLTLRVAPDTPPMSLQNLTLRAVAVVNGNVNLTHETKINVNIVK
jgi:hypothetical protein